MNIINSIGYNNIDILTLSKYEIQITNAISIKKIKINWNCHGARGLLEVPTTFALK